MAVRQSNDPPTASFIDAFGVKSEISSIYCPPNARSHPKFTPSQEEIWRGAYTKWFPWYFDYCKKVSVRRARALLSGKHCISFSQNREPFFFNFAAFAAKPAKINLRTHTPNGQPIKGESTLNGRFSRSPTPHASHARELTPFLDNLLFSQPRCLFQLSFNKNDKGRLWLTSRFFPSWV